LSDGLAIGCGRYAARRLGMNRSSGVVSAVGAAGAARFLSIWASSHAICLPNRSPERDGSHYKLF
jgi:hypothetical protein